MKTCRRCNAQKKTDKGVFCQSCAQYFKVIKRGHHAFKHVRRPAERQLRRQTVTLSSVWEGERTVRIDRKTRNPVARDLRGAADASHAAAVAFCIAWVAQDPARRYAWE
jgi:hypothetical protein